MCHAIEIPDLYKPPFPISNIDDFWVLNFGRADSLLKKKKKITLKISNYLHRNDPNLWKGHNPTQSSLKSVQVCGS